MFFNECFASLHFLGVQGIYLGDFREEARLKINDVVVWAMRWEFLMGLFGEHILKVFAPVQESGLLRFGLLSNLGRDGDLLDVLSI